MGRLGPEAQKKMDTEQENPEETENACKLARGGFTFESTSQ